MRVHLIISSVAILLAACSQPPESVDESSSVAAPVQPPSVTEKTVTWPKVEKPAAAIVEEQIDAGPVRPSEVIKNATETVEDKIKDSVETAEKSIKDAAETVVKAPKPAASVIGDASLKAPDTTSLEQEILALPTYPLAYEHPTAGRINEPFQVTLAIDGTGDDTAVDALPGEDKIVENAAKLSRVVEATLSGAAFDIKMTTKERQMLSPLRESVWRWSVTPLREGQHNLFLDVHAVLGNDESVLLDSFADKISVEVSPISEKGTLLGMKPESVRTYVGILAGLFSTILGAIALIGFIRKKKPDARIEDIDR